MTQKLNQSRQSVEEGQNLDQWPDGGELSISSSFFLQLYCKGEWVLLEQRGSDGSMGFLNRNPVILARGSRKRSTGGWRVQREYQSGENWKRKPCFYVWICTSLRLILAVPMGVTDLNSPAQALTTQQKFEPVPTDRWKDRTCNLSLNNWLPLKEEHHPSPRIIIGLGVHKI